MENEYLKLKEFWKEYFKTAKLSKWPANGLKTKISIPQSKNISEKAQKSWISVVATVGD